MRNFQGRLILSFLLCLVPIMAFGEDLYKVEIDSRQEANALNATGVEAIFRLPDGYLVMVGNDQDRLIEESALKFELIAADIDKSQMALNNRFDDFNKGRFPVLFEQSGVTIYRVDPSVFYDKSRSQGIAPIKAENLPIIYKEPITPNLKGAMLEIDLDSLVSLVEYDSLVSYIDRLQAFDPRVTGTAANISSRNWIKMKLESFGYDSVEYDTFYANIYGVNTECYNVVTRKEGSLFPDCQIVVGAHRDAVPGSPGADDNGSGTAGVLEMARILKNVETNMTIVFVLFDGEEQGLHGSWHYANAAGLAGDNIIMMFNMDMMAFYQNSTQAKVYHGATTEFSQLWIDLADSLNYLNLTGYDAGTISASDHHPFDQNGYDVCFPFEDIFSTVYHSPQDSSTYMDFDYYTRMLQVSLATVGYVDIFYTPQPSLSITYPSGRPDQLLPGVENNVEVEIEGVNFGILVPGSGTLHYSVDEATFESSSLNELGGGLFEAVFPALTCDSRIEYYISAEEDSVGVVYSPDPTNPFSVPVASQMIVEFDDNFENYTGWTTSGNASAGLWNRGIPAGGGERGDPPTDYDGSGKCYLTGNIYGDSDVDGGQAILISPTFKAVGINSQISYARWFSNNFGGSPYEDVFRIYLSNDNGLSWTQIDSAGPTDDAAGGWIEKFIYIADFLAPTEQMKIRFIASDLGGGSVVEAAVDAVKVVSYNCAFICGDLNGDTDVNILDVTYYINYLYKEGPAPDPIDASDVNNDGNSNLLDITYLIGFLYDDGPPPNCP